MPEHFVDRGAPLQGIEKTARDNRVPYHIPRSMVNLSLPDQRVVRRPGFEAHGEKVHRQILCKSTGTATLGKTNEDEEWKSELHKTPLSYGLLRWHADYQPKSTRDWTVEFGLTLGDAETLVTDTFERRAKFGTFNYVFREKGVYVYDQTVISNHFLHNEGTTASPATDTSMTPGTSYDAFPLTALAVGFREDKLFVTGGIIVLQAHGTPGIRGRYYVKAYTLDHTIASYIPGKEYHIGIVYDTTGRTLKFYVDGVLAVGSVNTYTLPANHGFPGEEDVVNGLVPGVWPPLQRDIVLLNEGIVRGGYGSACHGDPLSGHNYQTYYHSYDGTGGLDDASMPWCLSPPRGTGMRDLRIWHQELTAAELLASKDSREPAIALTNLKGSWPLDDGGPICRIWQKTPRFEATPSDPKDITLHHSYPGYVGHTELLHELGLRFADGQHMILSLASTDDIFNRDEAALVKRVFGHDSRGNGSGEERYRVQGKHDFTVQVQIRPADKPQEINRSEDSEVQNELTNSAGIAERNKMQYAGYDTGSGHNNGAKNYWLTDGNRDPGAVKTTMDIVTSADKAASVLDRDRQSHRAFDQTIWSVEGTGGISDATSSDGQRDRKIVARGLISPDGHVVFELYKSMGTDGTDANPPVLIRLESVAQLSANNTYIVTFVQRVKPSIVSTKLETNDFDIEIWIWDQTAAGAKPTAPNSKRSFDASWAGASTSWKTSSYRHNENYDIIIGASYVNSGYDYSISSPLDIATSPTVGPWKVPQHFMSAWQDQVLFADVGYFRMWANALEQGQISEASAISIAKADYTPSLIFNLEIQEISGTRVTNKSRYPLWFDLGYKSWGEPQGYRDTTLDPASAATNGMKHYKASMVPGAWAFEDCLGWMAHVNHLYDNKQRVLPFGSSDIYASTQVKLLAPYQSTLTQAFGLLAGYNDSLRYDEAVNGSFINLHLHGGGLLNEFVPGEIWRGTSIGDRTILTSRGGVPKVFNGRNLTYAGFKKWTGGIISAESSPASNRYGGADGSILFDKWYGVRIVYFNSANSIEHVSPIVVLKLAANNHTNPTGAIRVSNIPAHYDSRVTSIRLYRTLGQFSEDLARFSPLFPGRKEVTVNMFTSFLHMTDADEELLPAPLNLNQTTFPQVQYSASYNGKLWLAGDPIVPDALYYSVSGNPETVDTFENRRIIEEGSGDKITGLVAAYGALFVFKVNSIWRVVDVGGNQFQIDKISPVGAVSDRSILFITIPDSGRNAIFFWSQHGPYLYDGSTTQYLGRSIEEQDQAGESLAEYAWLDPTTTLALHDVRRREIIVVYTPKHGVPKVVSKDQSMAVVFNYRTRGWYRYKGMIGTVALSQSFTGGNYVGFYDVDPNAPALKGETNVYHAFLGGNGGQVYRWAEGQEDGISSAERDSGFSNPYTLIAFSSSGNPSTYTYTQGAGHLTSKSLSNLWLTVYRPSTLVFFTIKIVEVKVAVNTTDVTLYVAPKTLENESLPFTPTAGDKLYVAQVPAEIEFPWDTLAESADGLMDDKTVKELVTWANKQWLMKHGENYDDSTIGSYVALTTSAGKQQKDIVNQSCEAFKLFLASLELEARLDAFGYQVNIERRSGMPK